MTFAALAEHCKETRYCEAFYDEQGRKLYGVREPKKFVSMINRLVSSLGHLKLTDLTVSHLQQYRRKRLSTKTNRGTYTDVATVNREPLKLVRRISFGDLAHREFLLCHFGGRYWIRFVWLLHNSFPTPHQVVHASCILFWVSTS